MARKKSNVTYGKSFKTNKTRGKFRKGTLIRYKYINGKKSSVVKGKR